MSLRIRLSLIIGLLFIGSIGLGFLYLLDTASDDIAEELRSTADLTSELLRMMLEESDVLENTGKISDTLEELMLLEGIHHLDIQIESSERDYPQINTQNSDSRSAPAWFVGLVQPEESELIQSFVLSNQDTVVIRTNPADEIDKVWDRTINLIYFCLLVIAIVIIILFFAIGNWLKPIESIVSVLDNVERGDYGRRIPKIKLPELGRIAEKMNHLTSVLGASKAENERLTRRSLDIQEQERRRFAQELHDEMGQSISAIKAIAVSIEEHTKEKDPQTADSAGNIEEISSKIYESVRGMMGRLRPSILDELGLVPALQQMTDDWNEHHEDAFCRLRIDSNFDKLNENQQINIYRIVQEALTNIARHAKAENAAVTLSGNEVVTLIIRDDGVGYQPSAIRQGMGLSGIRERVQSLHGELTVTARLRKGVNIQIEFPRLTRNRRRASESG